MRNDEAIIIWTILLVYIIIAFCNFPIINFRVKETIIIIRIILVIN